VIILEILTTRSTLSCCFIFTYSQNNLKDIFSLGLGLRLEYGRFPAVSNE